MTSLKTFPLCKSHTFHISRLQDPKRQLAGARGICCTPGVLQLTIWSLEGSSTSKMYKSTLGFQSQTALVTQVIGSVPLTTAFGLLGRYPGAWETSIFSGAVCEAGRSRSWCSKGVETIDSAYSGVHLPENKSSASQLEFSEDMLQSNCKCHVHRTTLGVLQVNLQMWRFRLESKWLRSHLQFSRMTTKFFAASWKSCFWMVLKWSSVNSPLISISTLQIALRLLFNDGTASQLHLLFEFSLTLS